MIQKDEFLSSASKILVEDPTCSPFFCALSDEIPKYNPTNNWSRGSPNGPRFGMLTIEHAEFWIQYERSEQNEEHQH